MTMSQLTMNREKIQVPKLQLCSFCLTTSYSIGTASYVSSLSSSIRNYK